MTARQRKTLARHRRRMRQKGLVRLEVRVRKEDAPLVRGVAGALSDPARAPRMRELLRERFGFSAARGLKALLAAAPLEDIELDRSRDRGRTVDL